MQICQSGHADEVTTMNKFGAIFLMIATPLSAQDWSVRQGDVLFDQANLTARLSDQSITFYDGGSSRFTVEGIYGYTYAGGGTALGRYTVGEDSTVCITYENGFARCDLYVTNNARLIVITEDGDRYPVRPE